MVTDPGGGWQVVGRYRNPWGQVPVTGGGRSLEGRSRQYMERLLEVQRQPDPKKNRRHHYVPRTYLRRWSFDGKQIWALDTVAGGVKPIGLRRTCVEEDFYRVTGPDGLAHNKVELLFGVVDTELQRVQALFAGLEDPEELIFDDLIGLGVTVAIQRMRTAQQRRLRQQHNAWLVAQNPKKFSPFEDPTNPYRVAGIHTELVFNAMWEAADVMTTRSIELWDDPEGRFWTCDAPVLVPFQKNAGPDLLAAPYVLWPISPHRVVALSNTPSEEKAVIREASGKERGLVREAVEQGRERMIFASAGQQAALPATKLFRRRTQIRLRCSRRTPSGEYVDPPGCCVKMSDAFAAGPDVALCDQGLHRESPEMWEYA